MLILQKKDQLHLIVFNRQTENKAHKTTNIRNERRDVTIGFMGSKSILKEWD